MKFIIYLSLILFTTNLHASDGMVNLKSNYNVNKTTDRFVKILKSKGITVFTVVDHLKGANSVGLKMNPSKIVIFGNPKLGTQIMQCEPKSAIDLPMKALIWQDKNQQTWFSYNDMKYVMKRHKLSCANGVLTKISKVMSKLSHKTVQ